MFVYERDGKLCFTFDGNKPVDTPDVILDVAEDNTLTINDSVIVPCEGVELTSDTVYTATQVIDSAKTIVLNGNKVSFPEDTSGDGVFHVVAGGYLTFNGDGVIDGVGKNDYNMAIWADGGHVVINGGTFTNKGATSSNGTNDHFDLIYAKNGGIVEINGGYFDCETPMWTLNHNDKNPGKFIVKGGTFVGFDPANTNTEPAGANNNFVAEGYKSIYSDGCYKVVKI